MGHQLPEASLHVVEGSSLVVPLRIDGLPEEIDTLGERWLRKDEFHLTVISATKLESAGGGRSDLWPLTRRVASGRSIGPVLVREEIRRVTNPEKPGLRTLIVLADTTGVARLYEELAMALGARLSAQPTHITLYSSDPAEGIGINDEDELAQRAPPLSERDVDAARRAMRFDEVFFDDEGIACDPHDARSVSIGRTDAVFTEQALRAVAYAEHLHADQRRKGGTVPYLSHLLAVAALVAEDGGGATDVIGALLHDTAEDRGGERRLADIRRRFGSDVEAIVRALSDSLAPEGEPKEEWAPRKRRYLDHLRDEQRLSVLRVSNADKLHNGRSILTDLRRHGGEAWTRLQGTPEQQLSYYGQLSEIFAEKRPESRLARELAATVAELEREAHAVGD